MQGLFCCLALYGKLELDTLYLSRILLKPFCKAWFIENNEFNNFEFEILKDNTAKLEIKNNENTNVFKEITNEKSINNLLNLLQDAKEKDFNPESYDNFKDTGKIITLSFITKDGLTSSIEINLDLKIACINEKYYTVSSEMIKIIDEELKNIKDFNKN